MRLLYSSILLLSLLFFSCNKDQDTPPRPYAECVKSTLERNDMRPYINEEDLGCNFFFSLYEYRQQYYFMLNNHCADMLLILEDCQGNRFCGLNDTSPICDAVFSSEAISHGIVGVSR